MAGFHYFGVNVTAPFDVLRNGSHLSFNLTTPEPEDRCWETYEAPTTELMLEHMSIVAYILLPLCTALTLACIIIFITEVLFLNKNYPPHLGARRRKTVVVLSVYPMYAITSLMVMWVPRSVVLMELVSSSYFSFVLYTFLHLIPDYYGGREKLIKQLEGCEVSRRTPPCCCCCVCLPPATFSEKFVRQTKFIILQFAILRPGLTFIAAVMWTNGSYIPGSGSFTGPTIYIQIAMNISTTIAAYGMLVIMGIAAKHLPAFHLRPKFISIQLVFITTTLFGLIVNIVSASGAIPCLPPFSSKARASQLTHTLIIMEMVPLSVLGRIFYLRKIEYEDQPENATEMEPMVKDENGKKAGVDDVVVSQPIVVSSGLKLPNEYQSEV